ncbi:hypothetical protein AXF42_Ash008155 [Apostasia shenzhenica]|uniref:Uncharacterized protein n=1 Tax=Apostasia shenzhenica TaxID=1088818 RepID=A0A2I0A8R5_9ASPA|nr:hypothetical protein AXF42_Ash008155 [Apostasia shenzhenica]
MKSSSGPSSWNGQSASIRCSCNLECAIYTSRRSENTDRRFYRYPRYSTPLTCKTTFLGVTEFRRRWPLRNSDDAMLASEENGKQMSAMLT